MWRKRARWSRPTACASTSLIRNPSAADIGRVEDFAIDILLKMRRSTTRLIAMEEAMARARAPCSAKNTATRCASSPWAKASGKLPTARFSIELCGGTHVSRTGDIRLISVVAGSRVAFRIRRIEAKTGKRRNIFEGAGSHIAEAKCGREASSGRVAMPLTMLLEVRRRLEREVSDANKKLAMGGAERGEGSYRAGGMTVRRAR